MKPIILFLVLLSVQIRAFAQQNEELSQNIFVWDVYFDNGKKHTDPFLIPDIEAAIGRNKGTSVLNRRDFSNIPLKIKNEKANQKTDKISDALAKKLEEEGVKNILFATLTEGGADVILNIKIYSLDTRNICLSKDLIVPKNVFDKDREKKKSLLNQFIKKEVLGIESPVKKTLLWSSIGIGAGAIGFGLLRNEQLKKDWQAYYNINPFDIEKKYPSQNKKYLTNQYLAIGGGVVVATATCFLIARKITQKRKKKQTAKQYITPKTNLSAIPFFDNTTGLGFAVRF